MEPSSIAEQRATAVAKLKRAASLPRMKDGRRPPMHVEAVSEGERVDGEKLDEESAFGSDSGKRGSSDAPEVSESGGTSEPQVLAEDSEPMQEQAAQSIMEDTPDPDDKAEETQPSEPAERPSTPGRKRRSRSRARSRGSKDLRLKTKTPPPVTNESSADEYGLEDAPPQPTISSPIPSHFATFQGSPFLRSPVSPGPGLFYPGTTPSTPMLPSLEQIQKGIGLFRSNSVGAARMMAMHKLTKGSEPLDTTFDSPSQTTLGRNNTLAGGERIAVRTNLLRRLGERVEKADTDQTSGGEEISRPVTPGTARRRKRKSRRSAVLDDRDERDREQPTTSPNAPIVPSSPLSSFFANASGMPNSTRTPVQQLIDSETVPMGGRGVVIEDEDEDADGRPSGQAYGLPSTPVRRAGARLPHTSDAPSNFSNESAAVGVPVPFFMSSQAGAYKLDVYPSSPFATPIREKPFLDEDEELDNYKTLPVRAPSRGAANELSWVAEPVPRMPVHDDEDEDGEPDEEGQELELEESAARQPLVNDEHEHPEQEESDARPSDDRSEHSYYATSRPHSVSQDLVIEVETSPELSPSHMPPSPSSVMALSFTPANEIASSTRPPSRSYPMRLSVATPILQSEPSPSTTGFPEWEESRMESNSKRGGDSSGTWDRIKNVLTRSNSSSGRRSRTNSIGARDRRNNTDSSVSRESRTSITSPKAERGSEVTQQSLMQSPSASASILSLSPPAVAHTPTSPVPPASSADLLKYADSKLFPFPGMMDLERQRKQAKGISSASSPDLILSPSGIETVPSTSSASSATTKSPELLRERKVSHQVSDTRLWAKFTGLNPISPISTIPSSSSNDYFSINSATTTNSGGSLSSALSKLPTNREGVRKWLSAKKIFTSQHSTPSTPGIPLTSPPADPRPQTTSRKPSLSDLLSSTRKENELSDWEDIGDEKSRTPTSAASPSMLGKQFSKDEPKTVQAHVDVAESTVHDLYPPPAQSPRAVQAHHTSEFSPLSSPPDPSSSVTPDPQSSLDEYATVSTSDSLSTSSGSPPLHHADSGRAAVIMSRLDEALGRGSKSSIWPIAIDDPPRKLVLCSPVLQVTNANTVKDRFLFLFNDLLVIAKPVVPDQDALLDTTKPSPTDRKFVVKSVVLLRDVKFNADRDDARTKTASTSGSLRHPVVRSFVHQFSKDPDQAISTLFEKSHCRDDPVALGQLIFRTIDLDRIRLGEYLARRTSKLVLKAYVDSFGFAGMRIDKALRVFLLSICVPPRTSLDYLLDAFASRWFEANAGIVVYQKDLTARLVKAIVQLNEVMHGGIAQTVGMTGYPKQNVISRDFVEAFRRFDPRGQVSDDLLDKIYAAIRRERLSQARRPTGDQNDHDVPIVIKRPLPARLTYKLQSEPIILRIPSTDPHFTIQLFGQDLVFEPSELTFVKSPEASFRVTGTSLGPKTVIMRRCGARALHYSGLPLSSPVMVERAFMRNTFQLAFLNHHGEKRKYMFSVDDYLVRHQWTVSLKQHIEAASNLTATAMDPPGSRFKSQKAVEDLTLKVLQDTLISPEDDFSTPLPSAVDHALARLNGASTSVNGSMNGSFFHSTPIKGQRHSTAATHARSKSRSQVYHRHGLGKLEPDADNESEDDGLLRRDLSSSQRPGEKVWSGLDLEVICRQNSLLPSLLAYLSADAPNGVIT